ncbi:Polyketide synthase-nonribosomal peptide synthetase [Madurella mycetomatis]|uniref:Polyketide synthase-nonribosomal peptide synthetase n=1 Tax=Madurella mycetomatis TaxID=100816 RepID=A0A175WB81_9PEZI|nr:Polyketide synthase-nonribosomal peptide synthetase [Madurella mycetomatis]
MATRPASECQNEPIAIVGTACRFPGGTSSPSKLWELLRHPRDILSKIPEDRFNPDHFYHPDPLHHGTSNVRHSYVLSEDPRHFDAHFFGVKPIEANAIDPQQRILLEVAYEALEAAGIPIEQIQGSAAGVFVGLMGEDYSNAVVGRNIDNIPIYFSSGTARSTISNRISYFFDLHGPSITIDTACSSSLVALHQAVSSLRNGESSMALVAGANLLLSPEPYVAESKLRMLSPSGRSRMWDKDADGYGRGDGFAVLVLKTLSKALADGDSIECLVRETGINQDGRSKGITMPSAKAQMNLIRDTYRKAGLDPSNPKNRPQYFEAHGTGTVAGDPQEAEAIAAAFYAQGDERGTNDPPLYVGSIKTIIGHSEGAAGLAGVMKVLLAMKHGIILPNMLLRELSPTVRPFYTHLQIPETALDWPNVDGGGPRRASVNSFGFGGTNAHAILEEFKPSGLPASAIAPSHQNTSFLPFLFAAASEKSLLENISAYESWIRNNSSIVNLRDLSWTLSTRRSTLPVRISVSASSLADLVTKLEYLRDTSGGIHVATAEPSKGTTKRPRLLGIFTGQGAQWAAMGAELLRKSPAVARCFDQLQQALDMLPASDDAPGWSLVDELVKEAHSSRLMAEDEISQPLCTAVQIALVDLLRAAKVGLTAVVGHSSGEIAAAYAAGYISAQDAIRIAYYRGLSLRRAREEMSETQTAGAMLAVGTSPSDAQQLCDLPPLRGRICVAAKNSPTSVTLSGDADAIQDAKEIMEDEDKLARLLRVNTAYHSHHMLRPVDLYLEYLRSCNLAPFASRHNEGNNSDRPIWISSMTGEDIELHLTSLEHGVYWRDNMVQPVLFSHAVDCAVGSHGPFDGIVEIGPHPALKRPTSDTIKAVYGEAPPYIKTLQRGFNDIEAFADALGSLWRLSAPGAVDFDAFDRIVYGTGTPKLIKGLPTYSWNHERSYWHESRHSRAFRQRSGSGRDAFLPHPLLGRIRPGDCDEGAGEFRFRNRLSLLELPWLTHHKIQGQVIFPAAGYICAAVQAVTRIPLQFGSPKDIQIIDFSDVIIGKALVLPEGGESVETLLSLTVVTDDGPAGLDHNYREVYLLFGFYSYSSETATTITRNASGKVRLLIRRDDAVPPLLPPSVPSCQTQSRFLEVDPGLFYSTIQKVGYGYQGYFRGLSGTRRTMNEATGFLAVPEQNDLNLIIHPATLDCAVQAVLLAYCYPGDGRLRSVLVPTRIERLAINLGECLRGLPSSRQVPFYSTADPQSGTSVMSDLVGDVEIHAASGEQKTLVLLQGLHVTPLTPPSSSNDHKVFFDVTWVPESVTRCLHTCSLELDEVNERRLPFLAQIESIVGELTHRFPHMNILATETGSCVTSTFTGVWRSFLEEAAAKSQSRITYGTLDTERSAKNQNLAQGSYDLIMALFLTSPDAIWDPEPTLTHMRHVLRPGGYIVILTLPEGLATRGKADAFKNGIRYWDTLLRKTGFSGLDTDTIIPTQQSQPGAATFSTLLTTQAEDDRVSFLREPLLAGKIPLRLESLTILGEDRDVSQNLERFVGAHYAKVQIVTSLSGKPDIPSGGTVVCFLELQPTGSEGTALTAPVLGIVQTMFRRARNILWVTSGARSGENPRGNMIKGLLRSVALEIPDSRTQFLDFATSDKVSADIIAKMLLQLEAYSLLEVKDRVKPGDMLWYREPEVFVDENGQVLVPRLRLNAAQNRRYNSSRRLLTHSVSIEDTDVSITQSGSVVVRDPTQAIHVAPKAASRFTKVKLFHSLLKSIRITDTSSAYFSLGRVADGSIDGLVLLMSTSLSSVVFAPSNLIWPAPFINPDSPDQAAEALTALSAHILALSILETATRGRSLVVLDPGHALGRALVAIAPTHGVQLYLLTTTSAARTQEYGLLWEFITSQEPIRSIQRKLPWQTVSTFLDLSTSEEGRRCASRIIRDCLPLGSTRKLNRSDFVGGYVQLDIDDQANMQQVTARVVQAGSSYCPASATDTASITSLPRLRLNDDSLAGQKDQVIVSWDVDKMVNVREQPASDRVSFAPDKTYCDITDRVSVHNAYKTITETMAPIAGVVQGTMVLRDALFLDLDIDRTMQVLKPKVDGSIYLDQLFQEAHKLDFFIFFSSVAYVAGNRGQSMYAAANAFMTSVAARRRSRGLAASVIHLGAVTGEGYVSRELAASKQSALYKAGFEFMSEQAFHEVFAEGVLASPCRDGDGHGANVDDFEVTTGLRVDDTQRTDVNGYYFASNPIFQHLVPTEDRNTGASSNNDNGTSSGVSIRTQLEEATTVERAMQIITGGLLTKLATSLQTELLNTPAVTGAGLDTLGVDSLISVDIQSWFRKEVGVDLPIMRIINATSIQHLVSLAQAERMLSKIATPLWRVDSDPSALGVDVTGVVMDSSETTSEDDGDSVSSIAPFSYPDDGLSTLSSTVELFSEAHETCPTATLPGRSTSCATDQLSNENISRSSTPSTRPVLVRSAPLSFAQTRFWFLSHFVHNPTALNVTTLIRLRGKLDTSRLGEALGSVGQRHEGLRTVFYTNNSLKEPAQGVLPTSLLQLEHATITDENEVQAAVQEMRDHVFDLAGGQLLRLKVLSLGSSSNANTWTHFIILGYHHIAIDGIGQQVFLSDLEKGYYRTNLTVEAGDMLQYPDFSARQLAEFHQGAWSKELDYWRGQFLDNPPPVLPLLSLARKQTRPEKFKFASYSFKSRLSPACKNQIVDCCRRLGVTPFHFYMAVFQVLLHRYSGAEDCCVGTADSGRKDADVLQSLGLFLNIVPLRFPKIPHGSQTAFADVLRAVKSTSDDALAHSRVPIDVLLNDLGIPREPSHSPLFQAFFNYRHNVRDARATFLGCDAEGELISGGENAYDVSVDVLDSSSRENLVTLFVNSELYTAEDARILHDSYFELLNWFSRNPAARIGQMDLHSEEAVTAAIKMGRGCECVSEWNKALTVIDRIDEMAQAYPDRTALVSGLDTQHRVTYKQMAVRIAQVASRIAEQGILEAGYRVGLLQKPGPDWVCSFLAILRTGAVCVPLDPSAGLERLLLVVGDCQPRAILVDDTTTEEQGLLVQLDTRTETINISELPPYDAVVEEPTHIPCQAKPSEPAVITYTSGSTGVPKGIILTHASYKNFVEFAPPRWGFNQDTPDVVLQQSSYAFDMSLCQILVCLSYGCTLVIPDSTQRRDPVAICALIASKAVTFTMATPTEYRGWIRHGLANRNLLGESLQHWRGAMSGGEAMTDLLIESFRLLNKPDLLLVDAYGPAETTFACADAVIPLTGPPRQIAHSALRPLPNYSICIVDTNLNPVPAGVPGQVIIGGAGVAAGYWGLPDLNKTAFARRRDTTTSSLFKKEGWTTVHLSGDYGRLDAASGRLELHGRIHGSTQVKIGGIRIDLQDVENTILKTAGSLITEVAVSCRTSPGSDDVKFLVAFAMLTSEMEDKELFLAQLSQKLPLPQYMRPSMVINLEKGLPRTAAGKIDRKAVDIIPLPDGTTTISEATAAPNLESLSSLPNDLEQKMGLLWNEALPQGRIEGSIYKSSDDFFLVGGSSLALITLQSLIWERLGADLSLDQLFGASTLSQMAALVVESCHDKYQQSPRSPDSEVDWSQETSISSDLLELAAATAHSPSADVISPPQVVVLTGATGFIGRKILNQIVNDARVTRVYCVAVRPRTPSSQPDRQLGPLFSHPKVAVCQGDLSTKQLGLSDEQVSEIFGMKGADVIIHAGADVSFLKTYQTLRPANVDSTKQLVRLALPRRIPLHFVSTQSVAHLRLQDNNNNVSGTTLTPPAQLSNLTNGYVASKWVCETFLNRASQRLGLPVTIHRPGSVTGEGAPESDLMNNVVKYSELTRTVPELAGSLAGGFEVGFVSVEQVAETIIWSLMSCDNLLPVADGVRIVQEFGQGAPMAWVEIKTELERRTGEMITVLPALEWVDEVAKAGMNPLLAVYLRKAFGGAT